MSWVVFGSSGLLSWCYAIEHTRCHGWRYHVVVCAVATLGAAVVGLLAGGVSSAAPLWSLYALFVVVWVPTMWLLVRVCADDERVRRER